MLLVRPNEKALPLGAVKYKCATKSSELDEFMHDEFFNRNNPFTIFAN